MDIYLNDKRKKELAIKYMHYAFPDAVIEEATTMAADNAAKVIVEYLEKEIEDAEMGHRLAKMYRCLEALKELALDKPPEKV